MYTKAYILTNDHEASRDILQECWYAILKGINKLRDPKLFGVWVYRIVQGKCVDWIRVRQKQRKVVENEILEKKSVKRQSINEEEESGETVTKLRLALKELPSEQRFILSLHYLENHPINEIGEILKVPPGTVKSRLFHARKNLLKTFKKIQNH